jgi:ECF sigma factor
MSEPLTHEITALLQAWNRGDERALEKLTPLVYEELYRAPKRCISRGQQNQTLQTTALINRPLRPLSGMGGVSITSVSEFVTSVRPGTTTNSFQGQRRRPLSRRPFRTSLRHKALSGRTFDKYLLP